RDGTPPATHDGHRGRVGEKGESSRIEWLPRHMGHGEVDRAAQRRDDNRCRKWSLDREGGCAGSPNFERRNGHIEDGLIRERYVHTFHHGGTTEIDDRWIDELVVYPTWLIEGQVGSAQPIGRRGEIGDPRVDRHHARRVDRRRRVRGRRGS